MYDFEKRDFGEGAPSADRNVSPGEVDMPPFDMLLRHVKQPLAWRTNDRWALIAMPDAMFDGRHLNTLRVAIMTVLATLRGIEIEKEKPS